MIEHIKPNFNAVHGLLWIFLSGLFFLQSSPVESAAGLIGQLAAVILIPFMLLYPTVLLWRVCRYLVSKAVTVGVQSVKSARS